VKSSSTTIVSVLFHNFQSQGVEDILISEWLLLLEIENKLQKKNWVWKEKK
jgi:hypothetical protein